jgi:hypothetical protein
LIVVMAALVGRSDPLDHDLVIVVPGSEPTVVANMSGRLGD